MPGLFSFLRILLGPEAFREPVEKRRYLGVFLTCWNSGRDVVAKHGYKWHFRNIEWRVELLRRYVGACERVADVILEMDVVKLVELRVVIGPASVDRCPAP